MKILFVHEVNYETKPIFEMHEFPELLAKAGHTIGFVQFPEGRPSSPRSWICQLKELPGRVISDSVVQLYTPGYISGKFLGRLVYACTVFFSMAKIFRRFGPEVIVCYSVPTSGWQTVALAKRYGIPVVFRAIDQPRHIRKTSFGSLISLSERYIYRNVDWISANNPEIANHCEKIGCDKDRISIDLPPLDLEYFARSGPQAALPLWPNLPPKALVTVFLGTFFEFAGVEKLILSFSAHAREGEFLVLIGDGISRVRSEQLVEQLGLKNRIFFTGYINYEALPWALSQAVVAVNSMSPSAATHNALPNKVLQYLASGLPTVSTRLKGLALTFPNSPYIFYSHDDNDVYLEVRKLLDRDELPRRGEVREWVSEFFPNGYSASNLEVVCNRVLGSAS